MTTTSRRRIRNSPPTDTRRARAIANRRKALLAWYWPTRDELAAVVAAAHRDTLRQSAGGVVYDGLGAWLKPYSRTE